MTDDNDLYEPYDFATEEVVEDITLRARWTPREYTVTFVDEEGNVVSLQRVLGGNKAVDVAADDWIGLDHVDWYADKGHSKAFDFDAPITQDTTVYGLWNPVVCTVTFDSNGGSDVTPKTQEVMCESFATKPDDPVWAGHAFLGWYEDVTDQISPEDLESCKEWLLQAPTSDNEDYDAELAREEYQAVSERYLVVDGRTMERYDPATDPVYYSMTAKALWSEGSLATEVVLGEGVPKVTVNNFEEVARAILTQEEIGQGATLRLIVSYIEAADVSDADKAVLASKLGELGATDRMWLDISLVKIVGGVETKLESVPVPLELSVEVPEAIRVAGRTHYLLRAHGGEASEIARGTQDVLVGESSLFSTYLLASKDAEGNEGGGAPASASGTRGSTSSTIASTASRAALPNTADATPVWSVAVMAVLAGAALLLARII